MRLCLVRCSAPGDIIQTYPAVAEIRRLYPDALLHWVVDSRYRSLVERHPQVDAAISIDFQRFKASPTGEWRKCLHTLREHQYDIAIDLQGNVKSGLITLALRSTHKIGYDRSSVSEWPNLLCTRMRCHVPQDLSRRDAYRSLVLQALGSDEEESAMPQIPLLTLDAEEKDALQRLLSGALFIENAPMLVSPGSRWTNKELRIEDLATLLKGIQRRHSASFGVLWGSEREKMLAQELQMMMPELSLLPRLSLPLLQHLMHHSSLFIGMDSMPLHLAASAGTPTYAFFGPTKASIYGPQGAGNLSFQGACPYQEPFERRCPKLRTCSTGACLKTCHFDVERECEKIDRLLLKRSGAGNERRDLAEIGDRAPD